MQWCHISRNCIPSVSALLLHMIRSQSNNWLLWGGGGGGKSPGVLGVSVLLSGLPKPLPHHPLLPPLKLVNYTFLWCGEGSLTMRDL